MRRLLIHLAVALTAFVVGVKLSWAFAALFAPAVKPAEVLPVYAAPPAVKMRSCPTKSLMPAEVPAPPPAPVAPAAPKAAKHTRVVVRRADGTVEVIDTRK